MSDPKNLMWRVEPPCNHQMEQCDVRPWVEKHDGKIIRHGPWSKKCKFCGLTATEWQEVGRYEP